MHIARAPQWRVASAAAAAAAADGVFDQLRHHQ
jgi:hypothetical protein